jgi:excinuclease ABC subunit B
VQYNEANGITPQSIIKAIDSSLVAIAEADYVTVPLESEEETSQMTAEQRSQYIVELEERMREAAKKFEFEQAAQFRDKIKSLKIREMAEPGVTA